MLEWLLGGKKGTTEKETTAAPILEEKKIFLHDDLGLREGIYQLCYEVRQGGICRLVLSTRDYIAIQSLAQTRTMILRLQRESYEKYVVEPVSQQLLSQPLAWVLAGEIAGHFLKEKRQDIVYEYLPALAYQRGLELLAWNSLM